MLNYYDLRRGVQFILDGQPHEVLEFQQIKKARAAGLLQAKIKNLITGKVLQDRNSPDGVRDETEQSLIDTEQPRGMSRRFKLFVSVRRAPGLSASLGWLAAHRRLRRNRFVFGGACADRSLLDGEFDEFFLRPLHRSREHRDAAIRLLRSYDHQHVRDLRVLHARIDVPVQLVWGEQDRFFPVGWARWMVAYFTDGRLDTRYAPGGVRLVFRVLENPVVSSLEITGNQVVPTEKIVELMDTEVGQILNTRVLHAALQNIKKYYNEDLGYLLTPTHIAELDLSHKHI